MATDASRAAQILRGHEDRIRQLEESGEPDRPANLIRVSEDTVTLSDSVSTTTTETTGTKWDSADWSGSADGSTDMTWS